VGGAIVGAVAGEDLSGPFLGAGRRGRLVVMVVVLIIAILSSFAYENKVFVSSSALYRIKKLQKVSRCQAIIDTRASS
jgi:hypothetical protein